MRLLRGVVRRFVRFNWNLGWWWGFMVEGEEIEIPPFVLRVIFKGVDWGKWIFFLLGRCGVV